MCMTTQPIRFTQGEQKQSQQRYTSLMGMLFNEAGLMESFKRQPRRKAVGVDGVSKADYEINLVANLADLSQRVRRLGYRPKPARRTYIPKANGRKRPLGIPSFEDRIVQDRLSRILQMIWEPQFCECSYGFRPERSAHQALGRLSHIITVEHTQWLVEADIKAFFDRIHQQHLMRFIEHRIEDPNLLRVIQRFLKAGILEDGTFYATDEGTPQGGLVTPLTQKVILRVWTPFGARGGGPTVGGRWRRDGNAMSDDDGVLADQHVLDDKAHDSLALLDIKRVGGAA